MSAFAGKRAVVVGGTGGIGRRVAAELVARGASVDATGRDGQKLAALSAETGATGRVADLEAMRLADAVRFCLPDGARCDVLAVCFGPFLQKALHETTPEDWEWLARCDLALAGALVSRVLPGMMDSAWGRILLFGGTRTDSVRGVLTNPAYAACKTGLSSLARSVALAYARHGIACVVVCPGFVRTEFVPAELASRMEARSPTGRLLDPGELASAALDLLEGDPVLANGAAVGLDGGLFA